MRTKLADRVLPNYSKGEEIFNFVSHIVGGAIGVVVLVVGIIIASIHGSVSAILTSIVFGVSSIAMFTMSSVYHALKKGKAKKVMKILDHCMIYVLIAGTYTPILVCSIVPVDPVLGWSLLAVEWILAIVAIVFTAIDLKRFQLLSMLCNLVMGWAIILFPSILLEAVGLYAFILILSGGIFYTIGAILYGIGKKRSYMHCVFHIFVLLGYITQALAILIYVL